MRSYIAKEWADALTARTGTAWHVTRQYIYRQCDCRVGRHLERIVWGISDGVTTITDKAEAQRIIERIAA